LPLLLPAPVLFDNPDNAASNSLFESAGYPVCAIEMVKNRRQFVNPSTTGRFTFSSKKRFTRSILRCKLGGPSLQDIRAEQVPGRMNSARPDGWVASSEYLKRHGQLDKFSSFRSSGIRTRMIAASATR